MRNLAKFFLKRHFFFLFLFLEAISFTLIVESNKFHKARFLNYTSAFTGAVYTRIDDVTDYLALKDINRELADENARLKTMEKNSFIKLNNRDIAVDDTLYRQRYKYLSAKVIKSTTSFANNYIILNRGSEQGVEPEMAVMSKEGVIGLVRDVSGHYCSVLPLLHSRTRVSAMLENSKYQGIIRWDGRDPGIVKLRDIPQHVQLKIGEEVVTRGASGMFPEGVLVGHVTAFRKVAGSNFYEIDVALSVDFNSTYYVYIVKNILREEQLELELKVKEHE